VYIDLFKNIYTKSKKETAVHISASCEGKGLTQTDVDKEINKLTPNELNKVFPFPLTNIQHQVTKTSNVAEEVNLLLKQIWSILIFLQEKVYYVFNMHLLMKNKII